MNPSTPSRLYVHIHTAGCPGFALSTVSAEEARDRLSRADQLSGDPEPAVGFHVEGTPSALAALVSLLCDGTAWECSDTPAVDLARALGLPSPL